MSDKPEKGRDGTIAYYINIESSAPARIEIDNDFIGRSPLKYKVFGDRDGTFHNWGAYEVTIRAIPDPPADGLSPQAKIFRTGGWFSQEDRVPSHLYFDLRQPNTSTNLPARY